MVREYLKMSVFDAISAFKLYKKVLNDNVDTGVCLVTEISRMINNHSNSILKIFHKLPTTGFLPDHRIKSVFISL